MDDSGVVDVDALTRALDVHSLRILVAIDQTGSISAAARSLGYTQPTITQPIPERSSSPRNAASTD